MANVKFQRKEIEKEIKLNAETIEKISMMGIPVESFTDEEIEIQVLPNRPDIISMQGFIRAVKAFLGKETGLKKYKINSPEKNSHVKIDSSVSEIRPFTACAIVKGLKFTDERIKEIIDLQEKIHSTLGRNRKKIAIGIYPLDKISLPIKYEAKKPEEIKFMPLDSDVEMNGLQILQKHPTGREYAHLLQDYKKFPVFLDAKNKVLSMPPIINSKETGRITLDTTDIFIECSGNDFSSLKKTLNIIITTLADLGGKIYSMELDYKGKKHITPDLSPEKVKISLENTNKILGLDLKEKDLMKLLQKMGYDYKSGHAYVPSYRTDILHEIDVIEDIAIAYGYENLIPSIPEVATIGEESKRSKFALKISKILSGLGLTEISTYHLIKAEEAEVVTKESRIELENSKTDYKFLRPNLLLPGLRIFAENKDNEYPQAVFEIGTVFSHSKENKETQIKEELNLLIAKTPGNFTELKQTLDYLTRMLNLEYQLKEAKLNWLIDGRSGNIIINNSIIGNIGEVSPEILKNNNIRYAVSAIEINLDALIKLIN